MFNSPYKIKARNDISATALQNIGNCEALYGYAHSFIEGPKVATPVSMAFGTINHAWAKRIVAECWERRNEVGFRGIDMTGYIKYAKHTVALALRGFDFAFLPKQHGPRGEKNSIERIYWLPDEERVALGEESFRYLIRERIKEYQEQLVLNLKAIVYEMLVINKHAIDVESEYDFRGAGIWLGIPGDPWKSHLCGSIDQIITFRDGIVCRDWKTGKVVENISRSSLITNIQITIYDYIVRKMKGQAPRTFIFQGLNVAAKDLERYAHKALEKSRVKVNRNETHIQELAPFVRDVQMLNEVLAHPELYSQGQREEMQMVSPFAKQANLDQSLRQGRLIPRIGPWCKTCMFKHKCAEDHQSDWQHYRNSGAITDIPNLPPNDNFDNYVIRPMLEPALFEDLPKPRSKHRKESIRKRRRRMVEAGHVLPRTKLKDTHTPSIRGGLADECLGLVGAAGPCPCAQDEVVPVFVLKARLSSKSINVRRLARLYCVYLDCPHREIPE